MITLLPLSSLPASSPLDGQPTAKFHVLAGPASWTDPGHSPLPHLTRPVPERFNHLIGVVMKPDALMSILIADFALFQNKDFLLDEDLRQAIEIELLLAAVSEIKRLDIDFLTIGRREEWIFPSQDEDDSCDAIPAHARGETGLCSGDEEMLEAA